MNPLLERIAFAVAIGIGATLMMDLWNMFLLRAFGVKSLDFCLLGRWLLHIPRGTLVHQRIATAQAKPGECATGWFAHYSIGTAFAVLFVTVISPGWLARPTILPVVIYGIATVVFPLFFLQPALGLGIASSKTPSPSKARLKSLVTHTVFGIGMYLVALVGSTLRTAQ